MRAAFFVYLMGGAELKTDDKRYLCKKCVAYYQQSGFEMKPTKEDYTETCEVCNWHDAKEYEIKQRKDGGKWRI